jgi:hypothetical protein
VSSQDGVERFGLPGMSLSSSPWGEYVHYSDHLERVEEEARKRSAACLAYALRRGRANDAISPQPRPTRRSRSHREG